MNDIHPRACPKCGKITPWTRGKPVFKDGKIIGWKALLICPEHGEFRNAAEHKALNRINNGGC